MDAVEINAGQWYLRPLRADNRLDDRLGRSPRRSSCAGRSRGNRPDHVARCAVSWSADTSYSWAVCEVTTGELLAEVTLDPGHR
ncbi:hypothetical protein [Candidatus Mycobacterium methanotrophicum]|uniref:hypothetical protein n=1 Tax=Candidatus Mycobacterium methanotrophicum TaxID=2943498 RepID=UPI001C56BBA0